MSDEPIQFAIPLPNHSGVVDTCIFQGKVIVIFKDMSVWCRRPELDAKWLRIVPYKPKKWL